MGLHHFLDIPLQWGLTSFEQYSNLLAKSKRTALAQAIGGWEGGQSCSAGTLLGTGNHPARVNLPIE